ncbi:phosphoglycerate mutase family protein [Actinidia rufa]|uniref:Phosphoglycerate mutase family protein n=1 Tax=Actinidia rufa TaxID=165716 RepID=A0A7J0FYE0_9ERIC|nr:phosphoglycerate mutase family protein [Actinidia rufa]
MPPPRLSNRFFEYQPYEPLYPENNSRATSSEVEGTDAGQSAENVMVGRQCERIMGRLSGWYFLVRAGESEFESLGVINTNPVAKTSVDSGLSERGKKQTARAPLELMEMGACEGNCWVLAFNYSESLSGC